MSVRDYQSFRGPSYPPPHGSMLHRLVTCDVCGITIGLWLPDQLPAKYASGPIKCDYPTCKPKHMNTETPTTAAELLREWKRYNESQIMAYVMVEDDRVAEFQKECDTRAARLDEMW